MKKGKSSKKLATAKHASFADAPKAKAEVEAPAEEFEEEEFADDPDVSMHDDVDVASGDEEGAGAEAAKSSGKKRSRNQDKDISATEIFHIKETQMIYQSQLARLKFESLIKEATPQYKKLGALDTWLRNELRPFLESLPSKTVKNDLGFGDGKKNELDFSKPSSVDIVGSYLLRTVVAPFLNVDVAVQIPKSSFHHKDYLNGRYLAKRMLYLRVLGEALASSAIAQSVEYSTLGGNSLKPILIVKPAGLKGLSSRFSVRILLTMESDTFAPTRFVPERNNFREEGKSEIPSPYYNSSLFEDTTLVEQLQLAHEAASECPAFVEASMLLKVWAQQRGFNGGDGVSGVVLSFLVIHLLRARVFSKQAPALQILRAVFDHIANADVLKRGVVIGSNDPLPPSYATGFSVSILLPSSRFNVAYRVSKFAALQAKTEAHNSLTSLNGDVASAFDILFLTKLNFSSRFDEFLRIPTVVGMSGRDKWSVEPGISASEGWVRRVLQLTESALGNRVTALGAFSCEEVSQWPLSKGPIPSGFSADVPAIIIGAIIDPETAFKAVTKGPAAVATEAAAFRELWGGKSELRRFNDGSIIESVVWEVPFAERTNIPALCVSHVIRHHLGVEVSAELLSSRLVKHIRKSHSDIETLEAGISPAWKAFDRLTNLLTTLKGLVLSIETVQPSDPALRYTSIFPMAPNAHRAPVPAINVVIKLQKSAIASWPPNLLAVRRLLSAFLIRIQKCLDGMPSLLSPDHLDVFLDGFWFRLRIHSSIEWSLLQEVSMPFANSYDRHLRLAPQHHLVIAALHHSHPAFSHAVRITRRWLSSRHLSNHFPVEVVELLVSYVFVNLETHSAPPHTALSAFRRVLHVFAEHPWREKALVCIFDKDKEATLARELSNAADRTTPKTEESSKGKKPALTPEQQLLAKQMTAAEDVAMLILTPQDRTGYQWTRLAPTRPILGRTQTLAKVSLAAIDAAIQTHSLDDISRLLKPGSGDAFDFVIKLKLPKNFDKTLEADGLYAKVNTLPGLDPFATYLRSLEDTFGDTCIFFFDECAAQVSESRASSIFGLWRPAKSFGTVFKFSEARHREPLEHGIGKVQKGKQLTTIVTDYATALLEMKQMGEGLVSSVELSYGARTVAN